MANPSNLNGTFVWYDQMSDDLAGAESLLHQGGRLDARAQHDERPALYAAQGRRRDGRRPDADPGRGQGRAAGLDGLYRRRRRRRLCRQGEGRGRRDPSARRPRSPMSARSPSRAIRTARASFCSRETATRRRRRTSRRPAISAGTSCTPATARALFAFYSGVFGWTKGEAMDMGAMGKYQLFSTKSGQQRGGMMKKMAQDARAHSGSITSMSMRSTRPSSGSSPRGGQVRQRADGGPRRSAGSSRASTRRARCSRSLAAEAVTR